MLDEIRSFFDELRKQKPPEWPNNLSRIDPATESELRSASERHWHLAMESLDRIEAALIEIYEAGVDEPAAIDLFDWIHSIIRRKDISNEDRLEDVGQLLLGFRKLRGNR